MRPKKKLADAIPIQFTENRESRVLHRHKTGNSNLISINHASHFIDKNVNVLAKTQQTRKRMAKLLNKSTNEHNI